jgi:serine/threonine protein phosphatase PrpC
MDGHGGDFTAAFLAHTLPEVLEKTLRSAAANGQLSADHILAAVTEAFSSAESQLQSLPRMRVDVETTKNGRRITPVIDKVRM